MITKEEFEQGIRHLKFLCDRSFGAPNWKIVQLSYDFDEFCRLLKRRAFFQEQIRHILLLQQCSRLERVNGDTTNGSLLKIDEILEVISSEYRDSIESSLLTSVSQGEHPNTGVAFYHIHPCKTQQVMKDIHYTNYILSWLSVYGQLVGLAIPLDVYEKAQAEASDSFPQSPLVNIE